MYESCNIFDCIVFLLHHGCSIYLVRPIKDTRALQQAITEPRAPAPKKTTRKLPNDFSNAIPSKPVLELSYSSMVLKTSPNKVPLNVCIEWLSGVYVSYNCIQLCSIEINHIYCICQKYVLLYYSYYTSHALTHHVCHIVVYKYEDLWSFQK